MAYSGGIEMVGANQYRGDAMPEQPTELRTVEHNLGQMCERLAQSTGELGSIADRVFGTRPEPAPTGGQGRIPSAGGVLAAINERIEGLLMEISAIEERVKRLSAL